jgi:hypothetical protein
MACSAQAQSVGGSVRNKGIELVQNAFVIFYSTCQSQSIKFLIGNTASMVASAVETDRDLAVPQFSKLERIQYY